MSKAKVKTGLYKRDETRNDRTVSHDEITGMLISSKLLGTSYADEVWDYLTSHAFMYDHTGTRPYPAYHPAWIYFWGEWMDRTWTKVFYPIAFINILLATKEDSRQETSGKLLYFTLLKRDSFLYTVYKSRMLKIYGRNWIKEVFSIYFSNEPEDHPLIYLSNKVNNL
jgi:hypothetical protein